METKMNNHLEYCVDIVFCIDTTGSMGPLLDKVKKHALNFYHDLKNEMMQKGKNINCLRAKIVAFKDYQVNMITFADVKDQDEAHYGLKGSPTQVEKMFNPDRNDNKVVLKGDADSLAKQLFDVLKDNKYLGE